jgi:hypothetical protein
MSKAVKKVLTVAAAVAVAYFAPQVAATLLKGSAFATSTAATVVTSAAVNAAGNAAIAAATGGDVGKAAIMGAITGGVGGYLQGPAAGTTAAPTTAPPAAAAPSVATGAAPAGVTAAGASIPEVVVSTGRYAVSPLDVVPEVFAGRAGLSFTGQQAPATPEQLQEVQVTGKTVPGLTSAADLEAGRLANQLNSANFGTRALATLRTAGREVVSKFTDPKAIADMTLRAAGQLAGSALAGSGLSPEEQQLLAAQAADLQELKNTNQELYNLRLEQAKAILGEAARDYGFEEESRARVRGAGLTTAAVRGLTGERRRTELARQRRARAEEIATGRTRGELMTAQQTQAARQAGLGALPVAGPQATTMAYRSGLMGDYAEAERRRLAASEASGQFFGGLYGKPQAGLMGTEPTQEERDRTLGARVRNVFGTIV